MQLRKLFLGIIPLICSLALALSVKLVLEPKHQIKLKYGESLNITCRIEEESNVSPEYAADDLKFTEGGKILPSTVTPDRKAKKLFIEKPKKGLHTFYCSLNGQNQLKIIHIGTPPANVTNFRCVSDNLETLQCSWEIGSDDYNNLALDIGMKYELVYLVNGMASETCDIQSSGRKMWCVWSPNNKPVYRQTEQQLHFNLSSTNMFGFNQQLYQIDHYSIVKPKRATVELVSSGPHESKFIIKLHPKLVNFLRKGVECKIEYEIPYYNNTVYLLEKSMTFINSITYKCGLPYANTEYRVRVFIKTTEATSDEFWSEPSELYFTTQSEPPRRPPEMPVGAFESQSYDANENVHRRIYVYWKQLAECEEAANDFKYIYKIDNNNDTTAAGNVGYLYLNSTSKESLHISIWSMNEVGISKNSSHIIIPANDDTYLKINAFTTFSYGNGTYVVSWKIFEKIDNFTLFWCVHNEARICKGRIDYAVIDGLNVTHRVNLPIGMRYQFALAANKGLKSSGMKWSTCELSPDTVAMSHIPIAIDCVAETSYFKLIWDFDCVFNDGTITGFNITYYDDINNSNYKYIDNPKVKETTIKGLNPFTKYKFKVNVNTVHGLRSTGSPRLVETLQDKPSTPNIKLVKVTNDSVTISVGKPYLTNGNIKFMYFVIYNNDKIIDEQKAKCENINYGVVCDDIEVKDLKSYTNYSFSVQAKNSDIPSYSEKSLKLKVRTGVGRPGVISLNFSDSGNIRWDPPQNPGGDIEFYQIKIKSKEGVKIKNVSRSETSYGVDPCADVTYTVRAVNKEHLINGLEAYYEGEWSNNLITTCGETWWRWALIMFIILGGVLVLIVIFITRKLNIFLEKRKDISVILPPGLELPTDIPDSHLDDDETHTIISPFLRLVELAKKLLFSCRHQSEKTIHEPTLLASKLNINVNKSVIELQTLSSNVSQPEVQDRLLEINENDKPDTVSERSDTVSERSDTEPEHDDLLTHLIPNPNVINSKRGYVTPANMNKINPHESRIGLACVEVHQSPTDLEEGIDDTTLRFNFDQTSRESIRNNDVPISNAILASKEEKPNSTSTNNNKLNLDGNENSYVSFSYAKQASGENKIPNQYSSNTEPSKNCKYKRNKNGYVHPNTFQTSKEISPSSDANASNNDSNKNNYVLFSDASKASNKEESNCTGDNNNHENANQFSNNENNDQDDNKNNYVLFSNANHASKKAKPSCSIKTRGQVSEFEHDQSLPEGYSKLCLE